MSNNKSKSGGHIGQWVGGFLSALWDHVATHATSYWRNFTYRVALPMLSAITGKDFSFLDHINRLLKTNKSLLGIDMAALYAETAAAITAREQGHPISGEKLQNMVQILTSVGFYTPPASDLLNNVRWGHAAFWQTPIEAVGEVIEARMAFLSNPTDKVAFINQTKSQTNLNQALLHNTPVEYQAQLHQAQEKQHLQNLRNLVDTGDYVGHDIVLRALSYALTAQKIEGRKPSAEICAMIFLNLCRLKVIPKENISFIKRIDWEKTLKIFPNILQEAAELYHRFLNYKEPLQPLARDNPHKYYPAQQNALLSLLAKGQEDSAGVPVLARIHVPKYMEDIPYYKAIPENLR